MEELTKHQQFGLVRLMQDYGDIWDGEVASEVARHATEYDRRNAWAIRYEKPFDKAKLRGFLQSLKANYYKPDTFVTCQTCAYSYCPLHTARCAACALKKPLTN